MIGKGLTNSRLVIGPAYGERSRAETPVRL
jgi:hypothetical protein